MVHEAPVAQGFSPVHGEALVALGFKALSTASWHGAEMVPEPWWHRASALSAASL